MPPGVNLTAKLENIEGTNEPGYLRVTLCGFGPIVPCIRGTGILANAGIPKVVGPQVDLAHPITVPLWGNDAITPADTFYEIAVLDGSQNVIQAGLYQFLNAAGNVDLSNAAQIPGPYGFQLGDLRYQPCTGAVPGSVYVAPGPVVAVAYNGVLMPEGLALPILSFTVAVDKVTITLNFVTQAGPPGDSIDAFCIL